MQFVLVIASAVLLMNFPKNLTVAVQACDNLMVAGSLSKCGTMSLPDILVNLA